MSRTRRLLEGAFSAMLSKGVVLLVNVVSIPIMVRYLGAESFGVWVTISTALSMFLVLDLGIANALTNFISEAYARDDREYAGTCGTTALGVMIAIALLLGGIAWWIWPAFNWGRLFHLSSSAEAPTVGRAVAAALAIFLLGLPAGLATKILGGYQELRAANIFAHGGQSLRSRLACYPGPPACWTGGAGHRLIRGAGRGESFVPALDMVCPQTVVDAPPAPP